MRTLGISLIPYIKTPFPTSSELYRLEGNATLPQGCGLKKLHESAYWKRIVKLVEASAEAAV